MISDFNKHNPEARRDLLAMTDYLIETTKSSAKNRTDHQSIHK